MDLNHTEEVAIGIFQNDEVMTRFVSPGIARRSDLDEPLHLPLSVVCIDRGAICPFCLSAFPELAAKTRWALFPEDHEESPNGR